MAQTLHFCLTACLSATLVGIPLCAANPPSAPLGVVLQADHARTGTDLLSVGATVYDGDRLETNGDGALRALLGKTQIYLYPNTSVEVRNLASGFQASLTRGTVIISSADGETFQLLADGATIRPAQTERTIAQVTWVTPAELLVTSKQGALQAAMGDEVKRVEPGVSYRLEIQPDDSGPQDIGDHGPPAQGAGAPFHPARNHFVLFVIAAAGAGTGIGIWRALVSPSDP